VIHTFARVTFACRLYPNITIPQLLAPRLLHLLALQLLPHQQAAGSELRVLHVALHTDTMFD
jgi:hypothetical protein